MPAPAPPRTNQLAKMQKQLEGAHDLARTLKTTAGKIAKG